MENVTYGITRELPDIPYEEAVVKVTEAIATEGFGVLTEIDVKATLKKKLDVDFRKYVILGACNPKLAHRALSAEPHIGLLLPCNVIVMERDGGGSVVSAIHPEVQFTLVERPGLGKIACEVKEKLERALDTL
ncbi:DUF302 domain-containing protein [Gemmatimonadota bacterium]